MNGRYLGIDAGSVRVGSAISDPGNSFAMPLDVWPADEAISKIQDLMANEKIDGIVLGLPMTLRGEEGPQVRKVRKFADKLSRELAGVTLYFHDERMTSIEADRKINEDSGRGRRRGQEKRDALAAAIMLESWLRKRSAENA